jgi:hypothetical protein
MWQCTPNTTTIIKNDTTCVFIEFMKYVVIDARKSKIINSWELQKRYHWSMQYLEEGISVN